MRYYKLDQDGKIKGSYARNQPSIEGLVYLEEPTFEPSKRVGDAWIEDVEKYLEQELDKLTGYINNNWVKAAKKPEKIQEKFKENKDSVFSSIYEIDNAIEEIKLDMFTPEA